MAITFFGSASNPADNATLNDAVVRAITPPASMLAGDLVHVVVEARNLAAAISQVGTGGQTWVASSLRTFGAVGVCRSYWCQFDGTWDADPSWETDTKTGIALTIAMTVYRPSSGSNNWEVDVGEITGDIGTPSSPFDVTATGQTTTVDNTVTIAAFFVGNDITWTLQTGGWSNPDGTAQFRNTAGNDQCVSIAYKIQTAQGATGDVTNRESAAVGGRWTIKTWREVSLDTGAAPGVGAIAVAGRAPTILGERTIEPGLASLSIQGQVPTTTPGQLIPAQAALSLLGRAPEIIQQTGPNAGVGTAILTITGLAPTLVLTRIIEPSLVTSAADTSVLAPTILTEWTAQPAPAALTLGTGVPTLVQDGSGRVSPEVGSLVMGGLAVTSVVPFNPILTPARATLDLLGLTPELAANWIIEPEVGALTLAGLIPSLRGSVAWHNSAAAQGTTWHVA